MGSLLRAYYVVGIAVLILVSIGFYYLLRGSLEELQRPVLGNPSLFSIFMSTSSADINSLGLPSSTFFGFDIGQGFGGAGSTAQNPRIRMQAQGKHLLIIQWANLPFGAANLDLYRISQGTGWTLWQTIALGGNDNGVVRIATSLDLTQYAFYAEVTNSSGKILWTSSDTPTTQLPPNPFPTPSPTSSDEPAAPAPTSTSSPAPSPSPSPTPSPAPSPTTTPSTPPPEPPPSSPTGYYYYRPDGSIAGTYTPRVENFWVGHGDANAIQIGWQNLDASITKIVVYRSLAEGGPWSQLLVHGYSSATNPYAVQIVDDTIGTPHYYKMEARDQAGAVVATYGPLLLSP